MSAPAKGLRPARTRFLLTPAGRAALPVGIVLLLLGGALGGTYALFPATALCVLALAPLLARLSTRSLRLCAPERLSAFAGEAFVFELEIENGSRAFAARDLVLHAAGDAQQTGRPAGLVTELRPRERARVRVAHRVAERGRSRTLGIAVASSYPFGLLRSVASFELPVDLVVFPRLGVLADLSLLRTPRAARPAEARATRRGEEELAGVREWRRGEGLRRVHHRLSARRGRTIVHELCAGAEPALRVLLLNALDAPGSPARRRALESAIRLAATLVEHHLRRARRVLLTIASAQGASTLELLGRRGLWRALSALAELECAPGDARAELAGALARIPPDGAPIFAVLAARAATTPPLPARPELCILDVDHPRIDAVFQRRRDEPPPPRGG